MCKRSFFEPVRRRAALNILLLSVALLCTYSSMRTLSNAQKYIVKKIESYDPKFNVNSDNLLCVSFGFLSITFWVAPSIISYTGARLWLIWFTFVCIAHVAQFLYPVVWLLYVMSGIVGISAALSATAHGQYITLNSTQHTIARNSGFFWAVIQCSMFIGNSFIFVLFRDKPLDQNSVSEVFAFMIGMCILASLFMSFIGKAVYDIRMAIRPWPSFVKTIKIFVQQDMLLLSLTFIYDGIKNAFVSGVYSNATGFTNSIPHANTGLTTVALSGIMIGAGNAVGGVLFGLVGQLIKNKLGHYPVVLTGAIIHIVCFCMILINLPNDAVKGLTYSSAFVKSSYTLALVCSFFLGFGDACVSTQIYGIIAEKYSSESATAFALTFFVTNAATSVAYFYNSLGLYPVVGVLIFMAVVGSCSFCYVELKPKFQTRRHLPESFESYDLYMMHTGSDILEKS